MKNSKKFRISEYFNNFADSVKKYRNIERIRVIEEIPEKRDEKRKIKYYLCENQAKQKLIKSSFMLDFGYKKLSNGKYVPLSYRNVLALKLNENLSFSSSEGELINLVKGDYVVYSEDKYFGMKEDVFEKNYKSVYKAKKIEAQELEL